MLKVFSLLYESLISTGYFCCIGDTEIEQHINEKESIENIK